MSRLVSMVEDMRRDRRMRGSEIAFHLRGEGFPSHEVKRVLEENFHYGVIEESSPKGGVMLSVTNWPPLEESMSSYGDWVDWSDAPRRI